MTADRASPPATVAAPDRRPRVTQAGQQVAVGSPCRNCARALLAALLAACAPAGAPEHPDPSRPRPSRLRRDAALILSVEDSARGSRREGAHHTASRWYDHLRRVRGLPRWRIRWLKDAAVEPKAIARALAQVHWRIGEDATLWVIFVGRAVHGPAAPDGLLLGPTLNPDAGTPLDRLLARAGHGLHREFIAVLDGCDPDADAPWISGLPARAPPRLADILRRSKWVSGGADTLETILAETGAQMMRDLDSAAASRLTRLSSPLASARAAPTRAAAPASPISSSTPSPPPPTATATAPSRSPRPSFTSTPRSPASPVRTPASRQAAPT